MVRIILPHSHLVFRNLKLAILFRLLGEIAKQSFLGKSKYCGNWNELDLMALVANCEE